METSRAASLAAEGRAMLAAAVSDFAAIDGVEVLAFVSPSLAAKWPLTPDGGRKTKFITHHSEEAGFRALASQSDFALIIAPEFDAILETRCQWAEQCKTRLLGPSSDVVALCADKQALCDAWKAADVPTPPTRPFDAWAFPPPAVVKPRFGAGAVETHVCMDQGSLDELTPATESIAQPYLEGLPMSQAFLIGGQQRIALMTCTQHMLHRDGRLIYQGGHTFNLQPLVDRVGQIAGAAVDAVPRLLGYVGVDVLLRPDQRDLAIEINPRLTTSYLGLRELCLQNLMQALLAVAQGREQRVLTWRPDDVRFAADGATETVARASSKRR